MKKAAIWGGPVCNAWTTLIPSNRHLQREQIELRLLHAGYTHSQAEVAANRLLRVCLTPVVDTDSPESNLRSQRRDDQPAKSVSFHPREPLFFRWLETENGCRPAPTTGALDRGGNR